MPSNYRHASRRTERGLARRWGRVLVCGLLAALLAAPAAGAQEVDLDTSERERLEQEIARYQQLKLESEQRLAELGAALQTTDVALRERIAEQQQVLGELDALRAERDRLLSEQARVEGERAATEADITAKEEDLAAIKLRIQSLLLSRYKQRNSSFARVLSRAESFHDLRVKNYYLSLLARQDVSLVNDLDLALTALAVLRRQLDGQLAELEAKRVALEQNEASLLEREGRLAAVIAELETSRAGQQALQQEALSHQREVETRLDSLDSDLQGEIARLQQRQAELEQQAVETFLEGERARLRREAERNRGRIETLTTPLAAVGPDGFVIPLKEARLLTRFGEQGERAVTLRASTLNAPVFSMEQGRVIEVNLLGANEGYLVAIEHSPGVVMIYSNLHKPDLQIGDRTRKGEPIGFLGGGSLLGSDVLKLRTRVTKNGTSAYVDPGRWLGL